MHLLLAARRVFGVSVLRARADVRFGLELIGAPPQHPSQQPSQARNAETWDSDLDGLYSRLPSDEHVHAGAHSASLRYEAAPPQLPGRC